jgi:hypothetical protein
MPDSILSSTNLPQPSLSGFFLISRLGSGRLNSIRITNLAMAQILGPRPAWWIGDLVSMVPTGRVELTGAQIEEIIENRLKNKNFVPKDFSIFLAASIRSIMCTWNAHKRFLRGTKSTDRVPAKLHVKHFKRYHDFIEQGGNPECYENLEAVIFPQWHTSEKSNFSKGLSKGMHPHRLHVFSEM